MRAFFWVAAGAYALAAQSFDVASVKLLPNTLVIASGSVRLQGDTLHMRAVTLGWAIRWAYNLQQYELSGPEWIGWRPSNSMPRYDIEAKTTAPAQARVMLQHLLEQRFALKSHVEVNPLVPVIEIRSGPAVKLQFVDGGEAAFNLSGFVLDVKSSTMRELCDDLSLGLHVPMLDLSGLGERRFNATLHVPADGRDLAEWQAAVVASLRKDLGMLVTRSKSPVKVLVVDYVEKVPTAN